MEVITAHLPMRDRVLAGLQSSAAGTRPPLSQAPAIPESCQAGIGGATHPPRPRWTAPLSPPGAHSPRGPHHASHALVTGTCHVHPSWPDGCIRCFRHGRHLPLPFQLFEFCIQNTSFQRWRLFLCNLQVRIAAAMECNTSNATLLL